MTRAMTLTHRPTALSSRAHADRQDYVVVDDGRIVGRIYEFEHAGGYPLVLVHHLARTPGARPHDGWARSRRGEGAVQEELGEGAGD